MSDLYDILEVVKKKLTKDSKSGEIKTSYTTDHPNKKIIKKDGQPVEIDKDVGEKNCREKAQRKSGAEKQKGISKINISKEKEKRERQGVTR